jgi:hypothetical protein
MKKLTIILSLVLGGCAGADVEEERITEENGVYSICGTGPNQTPCRAADGETYQQELDVDTSPYLDSDRSMEAEVEAMKKQPFEQEVEQSESSSIE